MNYFKYILLFCLILFPITSKSYGLTNSWCSNGKYSTAISPFPKPQFNKCPGYAKKIMSKKEVEDYYFNGLGQEYFCNLAKKPTFFLVNHKRDDYKAIQKLFVNKQEKVASKCDQFFKIKLAKQKAIATKKAKEDAARKKELAKKKAEELAKQKTLAEKKAEEEAKIRALAEKLAKEEIARQLKVKQKEEEAKQKAKAVKKAKEDAARKKALAKKKAEKFAKQQAIAAKKAEEDKARKKALAKEKADELAKQKTIAAKKAEEDELKQRVLNEKIQKIKDEAKFIVATLKEYVTTDTNKLDILEVSELLENYNNEMQKGWSDTTVEKYEELYDYVQKDEGFIEFSADKKSKQLAAYNEEIIQLREYLTTSQSDLKSFITKNLGSNNAKKALKLAKATKKILKDFEVNQAMTLKNSISTWKAMNGVGEGKKYTFKILNKKTETKKQSVTKQVTKNKPSGTKSLKKASSSVDAPKDDKIGKFPEFLKGKLFFGDKRFKDYRNCNQIVKASGWIAFSEYKPNGPHTYIRSKFDKPFDDHFKGKIQLIENGSSPIYKVEYQFYDKKDGQCKNKVKYRYSFKDEIQTKIGCHETKCSIAGNKKNCRPLKQYSCVGYPPFR